MPNIENLTRHETHLDRKFEGWGLVSYILRAQNLRLRCLELMRSKETAHTLIRQATGSEADPEDLLRGFLNRFTDTPEVSFWRHHSQLYRKRPIFWPLQSPKRNFTVWVFQERFNRDTLFKVRSEFADPKARWLEARIRELKDKAEASAGAEKRKAEK